MRWLLEVEARRGWPIAVSFDTKAEAFLFAAHADAPWRLARTRRRG